MPRLRRKQKRRLEYGDAHREHLLTGHDFLGDAFGREPRRPIDWVGMEAAWNELRGELLPEWVAEHPGTRPFAWWRFSAAEPRRRRTNGVHPFDNPERQALVDERRRRFPDSRCDYCELHFGVPNILITHDDGDAEYETELAYLKRHKLLTAKEKAALKG